MAKINGVQVFWVKCNPERPERYQGKGPAKWTVQIRVTDKAQKAQMEKEFGFKFNPIEDDGKIVYKTTLSKYAFRADPAGKEDLEKPNEPVRVVDGELNPIDPDRVGNGSICNIAFSVSEDKVSRNLKTIQVVKWKVFEPRVDQDQFEPDPDFEVIQPADAADKVEDIY